MSFERPVAPHLTKWARFLIKSSFPRGNFTSIVCHNATFIAESCHITTTLLIQEKLLDLLDRPDQGIIGRRDRGWWVEQKHFVFVISKQGRSHATELVNISLFLPKWIICANRFSMLCSGWAAITILFKLTPRQGSIQGQGVMKIHLRYTSRVEQWEAITQLAVNMARRFTKSVIHSVSRSGYWKRVLMPPIWATLLTNWGVSES